MNTYVKRLMRITLLQVTYRPNKVDYYVEMISLFKGKFLIAMSIHRENLAIEVKPSQLYKVKLIKSIVWKLKLKHLD